MLGRIFGRSKDEADEAVCAECGRTLLAGEWTQRLVDEDGRERMICSLCVQNKPAAAGAETRAVKNGSANASRLSAPRESREESDAFWRALKEKDAEIDELRQRLARSEAEKEELTGRLAHMRVHDSAPPQAPPEEDAALLAGEPAPSPSTTADIAIPAWAMEEPASATWGETPADMAAALAEFEATSAAAAAASGEADADATRPEEPAAGAPAAAAAAVFAAAAAATSAGASDAPAATNAPAPETASLAAEAAALAEPPAAEAPPAIVFEDTQPIQMMTEAHEASPAPTEAAIVTGALAGEPGRQEPVPAPAEPPAQAQAPAPAAPTQAEVEAEMASLNLLQRGVDLLNVSSVPRKIAETNENLGLPAVHVASDGQIARVTFLWTMGWYRFHVDVDSGNVSLDDRGYEDRHDLPPNASVRADGTVQLAPAQLSRAAALRPQSAGEPSAAPAPSGPETPSTAAQKPPEILSKSLLGQRSDDEPSSWEGTKARDFDWDR